MHISVKLSEIHAYLILQDQIPVETITQATTDKMENSL